MAKIAVKLTTEITGEGEKESTNVYPYSFFKDHFPIKIGGKKQLLLYNFTITENSRVEIHFINGSKTISITHGNEPIDIPNSHSEMVFFLDEFHFDNFKTNKTTPSKERVAQFEFELI